MRNLADDVADVAIVGSPKCKANRRVGAPIVLNGYMRDLVIARPVKAWLGQRSHEALVIVCGRIDQMAQQLKTSPFALAA